MSDSNEHTYILLQAPKKDGEYETPEIRIVDNSGAIGKDKAMKMCLEGWKPVGTVTTPLTVAILKNGITRREYDKLQDYEVLFKQIDDLARKWLEI